MTSFISLSSGRIVNLLQICYLDAFENPDPAKGQPSVVAFFPAMTGNVGALRVAFYGEEAKELLQMMSANGVSTMAITAKFEKLSEVKR